MAATLPYSRSLSQQLWFRSTRPFTRPGHSNALLRVSCPCSGHSYSQISHNGYSDLVSRSKQARAYATTVTRTARKTKEASGRTTAVRKTTVKKSAKKPAAKKAVKKPKKKKATKPKPKKPRVRKAPTKTALAQKARLAHAELRATALLDRPKQLPATAYALIVSSESKGTHDGVREFAARSSAKYKALSAEEREVRVPFFPSRSAPPDLSPSVLITKRIAMQKRMPRLIRHGFNPIPLFKSKKRTTLVDSSMHRQRRPGGKLTSCTFRTIEL